jgi:hypothetical protein
MGKCTVGLRRWLIRYAVVLTLLAAAASGPRASASTGGCFDIVTDGAEITHILVDSTCAASPSDYAITVDGEPVTVLHTDDGPCESLARGVWFPLQGHQDTAHVCVSVRGECQGSIQVAVKAGDECVSGTQPF